MNTPEQYQDNQEIKPILSIGSYVLGKYQKKEEELKKLPEWNSYTQKIESKNGFLISGDMVSEKPKKKRGIVNQRQQVLEEIRTIINKERTLSEIPKIKDTGFSVIKKIKIYHPLTGRALAIKLSHIPTEDLYFLLSEGKDYKKRGKGDFGKYLFGSIKPKK